MKKFQFDIQPFLKALGRTLIALLFILAGFDKLMNLEAIYAILIKKQIVFMGSTYLTFIFPLIELILGFMLLVGYRIRVVACVLCFMVICSTFLIHNFWTMQFIVRMLHVQLFLKNLALIGFLLYLCADEPDSYSLDAAYKKLPKKK